MNKKLSTEAYKGTRDFYPEDMAVQRFIFDTWSKTAELFGYERYDASILEPSDLYKSKGAENEEMVNEQTYTFIDRGEREVTLRPEMTPTVARMIAHKRRELSFPVRWYAMPNLFRYERPQRGRLREHWQLNCDMFGSDDISADVEIIALAYNILKAFGAQDADFEIRINDRALLNDIFARENLSETQSKEVLALLDRKEKISTFHADLHKIIGHDITLPISYAESTRLSHIIEGLSSLSINNVLFSPSTVRGFSYYTGTVFEIFDTDPKNNRSLIGGGRYDNLTSLFGGDPVSGIGFGMGDVTMRDFLETHKLLPPNIHVTAPTVVILPTDAELNIEGEKIAQQLRSAGVSTSVDISNKKLNKKLSHAGDSGSRYVLIVGTNEISSKIFTLKQLSTKKETIGTIAELITIIS